MKQVLSVSGSKRWAFRITQKADTAKDKDPKKEQKTFKYLAVCLPYVSGVTEKVQRILGKYEVNSHMKPYTGNTLKSLLVIPRDKPQKEMCGVVYQLECHDCSLWYERETARALKTRFREHTGGKQPNSVILQHVNETRHSFSWEDVKILDKELSFMKDLKRKIREALHIHRDRPDLSHDVGREIPANLL